MAAVFLYAVFKPFLNRPWHGATSDDRSDGFLDGWLPSNHSTYGVCERKYAISNTPPPKKNHTLKDRESEGATAPLRNGKWGARETCFEEWSSICLQCALWHHCYWSGHPEEKIADHLFPILGLPTEYYSFKRCRVHVGHPVYINFSCWIAVY